MQPPASTANVSARRLSRRYRSDAGSHDWACLWSDARRKQICNDESDDLDCGPGRTARLACGGAGPGAIRVHGDLADLRPARLFLVAASFVTVFEKTKGPNYIREAVLKGETVKSWTQMITVTGAKGPAGNDKVSSKNAAASMVGGFKIRLSRHVRRARPSARPGSASRTPMSRWPVAAGSKAAPTSTARPRSSSPSKAVPITTRCNGPNGRRQPAKPAIDETKWVSRLRQLQPIRLCPIVPGEQAPFPLAGHTPSVDNP